MTRNQVEHAAQEHRKAQDIRELEETRRSNKTKEREQERSNRERERETRRSNIARELGNLIGLGAKANSDAAKALSVLGNDPSWYNLNKNLVDAAANLSFHTPLRGPINLNGYNVPRASVLTMDWIPSIGGDTTTAGSLRPVVIAAQNIYAWVRHANSGASNYEPNDLMMYLLAMDSAYTMYAFGRMIYRMCLSASAVDLTYPQAWFKSCRINRDTFMSSLADFRWFLETTALRLNVFFVPSKFPYFNRHVWMVSNLFKDCDIDKTAYYYYKPNAYGEYDDVAGRIEFTDMPNELTLTNYKQAMTDILNALYSSEDIGIMSGDIKKAYGDDLFTIDSVPMDDVAAPFYSKEVLQQINNTILVGTLTTGTYDIYQEVGSQNSILQGNPTATTPVPRIVLPTGAMGIHRWILNQDSNTPTVDDIMVSTRNMTLTQTSSGSETYEYINVSGSEIFTMAYLSYAKLDSSGSVVLENATLKSVTSSLQTGPILELLSQMDWAPCAMQDAVSDFGYLWDLENFAYITPEVLANMHATAILSEFYIPTEGLRNVGNKVNR